MADIFISYSRKDSAYADRLSEQLTAAGIDTWIDRKGIDGAERWATEIVEGIRACSTFMVLLSSHSLESDHVLRELLLASEKGKRILPVDIEPATLSSSFEYPLAGLQRVAISDFDAIIHAHKHGVERLNVKDARKSLMILPFEDLSPEGEDNAWFADGLTGELISALSNIKSLRIPDRKTSMDLKNFHGRTIEIASDLDVRYFIEGSVRKFGSQIKISLELLDIESGEYLWQHSYRGEFKDIFDIQEAVAKEVVVGLQLHLTSNEQQKLKNRGTGNAEAYELYIKATEYFDRNTQEGYRMAIQLLTSALALDPQFAKAHSSMSHALAALYRAYDRNPRLIQESESQAKESLQINPDLYSPYAALSEIYLLQGKFAEAEAIAKEYVLKQPNIAGSHFALAQFYAYSGQSAKAIAPVEEAIRLDPNNLVYYWNLANYCDVAGDIEKRTSVAAQAIPRMERFLRLQPDNEQERVRYAVFLFWNNQVEKSHQAAIELNARVKDGVSLYNIACLFGVLGDKLQAIKTCQNAIDAGFRDVHVLKQFLGENEEGVHALEGTQEYEALQTLVESLELA